MRDRALTLLGQGHSQVTVAAALGVSESYISQLLSDEDFHSQVVSLRAENLSAATELDNKYNKIENALVDKLEVASKLFVLPRDILNALVKVNSLKRRGAMAAPDTVTRDRVVVLQLPSAVKYEYITNINQQVVEIKEPDQSHSLITVPIKQLGEMAHERETKKSLLSFGRPETGSASESSASGTVPEKSEASLAEFL